MRFLLSEYERVLEQVLATGGRFQLYPRGSSMLPLIREERDFVWLEALKGPVKRYDILLYRRRDGHFVLHRVMKCNTTYTMAGDNQTALETGIQPDQILGVVTGIGRAGKIVQMDHLRYRFYVLVWCRCFLFRRIALKLLSVRKEVKALWQ